MSDLKPCPFCGHAAVLEVCDTEPCNCGFQWIGCLNDDCPVEPLIEKDDGPSPDGHTTESAIAAWNTRPPPAS